MSKSSTVGRNAASASANIPAKSRGRGRGAATTYFDLPLQGINAGPTVIDSSITINSETQQAEVFLLGNDASASAWTATQGSDFAIAGSGNALVADLPTPFLDLSECVSGYDTTDRYFLSDSATDGQLGTSDFVIEVIAKTPQTISQSAMLGTRISGTGWVFQILNSGALNFYLQDSGGATSFSTGSSFVSAGTWYHFLIVADRSGFGIIYSNGDRALSASSISAVNGDITSPQTNLRIFNPETFVDSWKGSIAQVGIWTFSDIGTWDQDAFAKERFSRVTGIWPRIAAGTAAPELISRDSVKTTSVVLSDGSVKLFQVGKDWPDIGSEYDEQGAVVKGYRCDPGATNLVLQSQDFSDAAWTKNLSAASADSLESPWGVEEPFMDALVADSGSVQARFDQAITVSNTTRYTASMICRPGNKNYCYFRLDHGSGGDYAHFDLANGVVGNLDVDWESHQIVPLDSAGNFYLCQATFVSQGTSITLGTGSADALNGTTTTGDAATENMHFTNFQMTQTDRRVPHIPTAGGTAASQPDQLRYKGDDGNIDGGTGDAAKGQIIVGLCPLPSPVKGTATAVSLNDGGSSANIIELQIDNNQDGVLQIKKSAGTNGDASVATTLTDGVEHVMTAKWNTNSCNLKVDGTAGTEDTTVTPPIGLDRIEIGVNQGNANQLAGRITGVKIKSWT